jgi:AcrR family transcriptional regulator
MSTNIEAAPRKLGRPRDARADVAILEAVLDLVARSGLPQLSMDAVAAKAGVGKATIYRRWPSKEALVVDAWRTLIAPAETPDTGSLRGDVEAILGTLLDKVGDPGFDVLSQVMAAARADRALAEALREYVATRRRPLRTVLERAVARGELSDDIELDIVQDALVGPLFYRLLLSHGAVDLGVARSVIDVVLAGIVVDPAADS